MSNPVLQTELTEYPVRRGKVRDIYDLGDQLLMVSTELSFEWK
jgi:phosphoribosylaminoimidazole-succinocarboxamide synthase